MKKIFIMKLMKFVFVLCIALSFTSCSEETNPPSVPFTLSVDNLAGTYNISAYNSDIVNTVIIQDATVNVSNAKKVGDTFQVDFILKNDGTYTAEGRYRIIGTVTPVGQNSIVTPDIIVFSDSGTFTINIADGLINFNATTNEFLKGELSFVAFNENSFSLTQQTEVVDAQITSTANTTISFVRQ